MDVTITTWNILAKRLATQDSFPAVKFEYLDWKSRFAQIISYIVMHESDIVVLQEVDEFDAINEALKEENSVRFGGSFYLPFHHGQHGIAVFWDTSKFALDDESDGRQAIEIIEYEPDFKRYTQRAVAITFVSSDETKTKFTVIGVHLKSKPSCELSRVCQMNDILKFVKTCVYPVIIAGDLNAKPNSIVCQVLRKKQFRNCFDENNDGHNDYFTTRKFRNSELLCYISDYIWWGHYDTSKLNIEHTVMLTHSHGVLSDDEKTHGFPSDLLPSDHVPVTTEFYFESK